MEVNKQENIYYFFKGIYEKIYKWLPESKQSKQTALGFGKWGLKWRKHGIY